MPDEITADRGAPCAGEPIRPLLLGEGWLRDRPGGLNRYLAELFEALRDAGVKPRAVVIGSGDQAPAGLVAAAGRNSSVLTRLVTFNLAAKRCASEINLVDAHFALYAFWPVVFGKLRRMPLVVHFQGPWAEESRINRGDRGLRIKLKRALEMAVYRRAAEVVVLSAAFKQLLVERYRVSPWQVSVVPPGVDLERFTPGAQDAARRTLGIGLDAKLVVVVRRLVPRMGLDVLVRAWAQIARHHPDAILLLVGEGPERGSLERLAAEMGVSDSVRFLGRVDDAQLVGCYRAADLAVVPTTALEGYGLVVLEALACGVPVVVSDAGGLPEAVAGLDASLVVPAADADALAARVSELLGVNSPRLSPQRCRDYAETFNWDRVAGRHCEIYRRALTAPPLALRIVFIDHCAQLSGGEISLLELVQALGQVEVHVILGEDGPLVGKLLQAGVSVEVLAMSRRTAQVKRQTVTLRLPVGAVLSSVRDTVRMARRLRRLRPDIVHANSLKAGFFGLAAARLAGVPGVWHIRDRIAPDYLPGFAVKLVRIWARLVPAALITNSEATRATLPRRALSVVVPSSVRLVPAPARAMAGGSPERPFTVGMLGRLQRWKGQDVLLRAFAEACPESDSRVVLIGSAMFGEEHYEQQLRDLAGQLGFGNRLEMRGFRPDVAAELAELDVLVHASVIPEPFGRVVVEGMAAGLPVVASAAGGPAEVITDGVDGLLYPPGDWQALAQLIRRLRADGELRRSLGQAGMRRSRDFSPEESARKVLELYRRLSGRPEGAGA